MSINSFNQYESFNVCVAFGSVFNLNVLSPPSCLKIRSETNSKDFTKSVKTLMEAIGMTSVLLCSLLNGYHVLQSIYQTSST